MAVTSTNAGPQLQIAVFIDFENIALGLRDSNATFEIGRILDRLLEKGKVMLKVAYADWNRFRSYTTSLHEHGIELIEIPRRESTGKNSADIRLVVDAMDLSWSKGHIDTFVVVSGDSDFSPLVAKLKENGKYVIGLGMKASTSPLLANSCDEFIYYEDLERGAESEPQGDRSRPSQDKPSAFRLLADTVRALQRENFEVMQASLVKDTMKRKRPAFSEAALGYGSFSELLEDAQAQGIVTLRKGERSGTYIVTGVASERPAVTRPAVTRPAGRGMRSADARPAARGGRSGEAQTVTAVEPTGEARPVARAASAPTRARRGRRTRV